jgi:hypothetical protein
LCGRKIKIKKKQKTKNKKKKNKEHEDFLAIIETLQRDMKPDDMELIEVVM